MNPSLPAACHGSGAMPSCESAVEWLRADRGGQDPRADVSRFRGASGMGEFHVTVQLSGEPVTEPLAALEAAWLAALERAGLAPESTVMRRIFCSDVINQAAGLARFRAAYPGAVSVIGQAPLPAAKFAIWSQHWCDPNGPIDTSGKAERFTCRRGALTHYWSTGWSDTGPGDAGEQTRRVLENHDHWLEENGMTLAGAVVRTWWYVRNVDADYAALVDARREVFATHGLTPQTHYIASTGIAGADADTRAHLSLDSFAIAGLREDQVTYLQATDHLCPTQDYGVTFERATAIDYEDRRQIWISGTASIDAAGRIVHPGDVSRQLDRTIENIAALLEQAGANPGDLAVILVYLRDPADAVVIGPAVRDRLGGVPMVLLHAPVCRPGWLIEIEGLATVPIHRPDLPAF